MFKIWNGADAVKYSSFLFSGGETQIRILPEAPLLADWISIYGNISNSQALFELALLVDALHRRYPGLLGIYLTLPYLPYARQDRVCAPGEALSLKVLADFINAMKFTKVTVWDAHSDVALALIDRVVSIPQEAFAVNAAEKMRKATGQNLILVSPDAGAVKKTMVVAKAAGLPMTEATKHRDPGTGEITGTTVNLPAVMYNNFLIVDDICDGGRTFIELAKVLQGHTSGVISLYVTHGIFSKGFTPLMEHIDHIYVANPLWANNAFDGKPFADRVTSLMGDGK